MEAKSIAVAEATEKARRDEEAKKRHVRVRVSVRHSTLTLTLMGNLRHETLKDMGLTVTLNPNAEP